jgi:triosephosphate isomerase
MMELMRKPFVAGNWKMNNTVEETRELTFSLVQQLGSFSEVERVIFPPFTALMAASALLEGSGMGIGAQDMHWMQKGAFTGEISASMVKELCAYVILGHSERRAYFHETDEVVNRKLMAAQASDLTPVVCIGETLEEYESGRTREVIERQIDHGFKGLPQDFAPRLVVAYEPVWAIGTGRASSAENANSVVADIIRPALASVVGESSVQAIRVLYGGSVTAANATEFFSQPQIDGALVGGASLKVDEFVAITQAAVRRAGDHG